MAVTLTSRPLEQATQVLPERPASLKLAACSGFTLLEILVAIFIFAVVVTTIFGSFNSVFSRGETLQDDIAVYEMAKRCLNRMSADLRQAHVALKPAYVPPASGDAADPYRFSGEVVYRGTSGFHRLRFASRAHLPMGSSSGSGIARIVYYPVEDGNGGMVLRRSDRLEPAAEFEESPADPVVCENVRAFACTFYDSEGKAQDGWDSDADEYGYGTPAAVGIRLEIGDQERPAVFKTRAVLPVFRERSE